MNSNHKSISSRTKKPVLGLILGARQMRLIPYFSAGTQWPSATYRKWGDPRWHVLLKLKFTCLWLRTLNTWLALACLLYPKCIFHGRCKQSVSVASSKSPPTFFGHELIWDGTRQRKTALWSDEWKFQTLFWKSSILHPPGWRWL